GPNTPYQQPGPATSNASITPSPPEPNSAAESTVAANAAVGAPTDARDYRPAASALAWLGVASARLATNNPHKIDALRTAGITVDRVPLSGFVTPDNRDYLGQKDTLLGHLNSSGAAAS
ncbi:hypothetical protein ABZ071_35850, partial [Micromonospora fulviviridis]